MASTKFLLTTLLLNLCNSITLSAVPTPTFLILPSVESSIAVVNDSYTLSNETSFPNKLPPDPYYLLPLPPIRAVAIQFSKYTAGISATDALQCLFLAQRDTAVQSFRGNNVKLIGRILTYRYGTVTLTFNGGNAVRWSSWGLAMSAIPQLFNDFEFVGFDFLVLDYNAPVGLGTLSASA